jgi:2-polyprenyl-3-methyl-5-hydroxy-6-metoxy-1,4-benzoquinol methylase
LRIKLKNSLHTFLYLIGFFLPIDHYWKILHRNSYHPGVEGIIERIENETRLGKQHSLFCRWSQSLNFNIDLEKKSILEIGHGGAWYLVQAKLQGATRCVGIELLESANTRARIALDRLGFRGIELYEGNGKDLSCLKGEKFDFILSSTVFQHMHTKRFSKYLEEMSKSLTSEGMILMQILQTRQKSVKRLSKYDLYSVEYGSLELKSIIAKSNLKIFSEFQLEYGSVDRYWGIYALKLLD